MAFDRLFELPVDVLLQVFENCNLSVLTVLCRLSKAHFELVQPVLYQNVDLSCHNLGFESRECGRLYGAWSDHPENRRGGRNRYFVKQRLFLRTISERPSYGAMVTRFSWTFLFFENPRQIYHPDSDDDGTEYCSEADSDTRDDEDCRYKGDNSFDHKIWYAFEQLCNVHTLDLFGMALSPHHPVALNVPSQLFPLATSIKLGGALYYNLVTSILHSVDPSSLTRLTLDNLQEPGLEDTRPREPEITKVILLGRTDEKLPPPGLMRGYLKFLEGRCSSLKVLILRRIGQSLSACSSLTASADEAHYNEWASFLGSVSKSLRVFVFEQGLTHWEKQTAFRPRGCRLPTAYDMKRYGQPPGQRRPMDCRFIDHFLPIIVNCQWPKLQEMTIRGAVRSTDCVQIDEQIKTQIEEALPLQTRFHMDATASQTFEIFRNCD